MTILFLNSIMEILLPDQCNFSMNKDSSGISDYLSMKLAMYFKLLMT